MHQPAKDVRDVVRILRIEGVGHHILWNNPVLLNNPGSVAPLTTVSQCKIHQEINCPVMQRLSSSLDHLL